MGRSRNAAGKRTATSSSTRKAKPNIGRTRAKNQLSKSNKTLKRRLQRQRRRQRQRRENNNAIVADGVPSSTTAPKRIRLSNTISVPRNSIHAAWKQALGGLIRWYVNSPTHREDPEQAMQHIQDLYLSNHCSLDLTKDALLREIASQDGHDDKYTPVPTEWLQVQVAVETTPEIANAAAKTDRIGTSVLLTPHDQPGEGPVHAHETWKVVTIPPWALGRSYFVNVVNNSSLDLSCEMTVDGHSVAKNAPIPAKTQRTIRPANHRYFREHEWRFQPAQRVALAAGQHSPAATTARTTTNPRFNGKRPQSYLERLSLFDFPDPTQFGWEFLGSTETSRVEFFRKDGVRLDFYYTTGTVKTVLDHPTAGRNQLFRSKCTPETYRNVMLNPRHHSNVGYRRARDDPTQSIAMENVATEEGQVDEDEDMDDQPEQEPEGQPATNNSKLYYAQNKDYKFDQEGHTNRHQSLQALEQGADFLAWERASQQDWACIHAKFYVSLRNYMRKPPSKPGVTRTNGKIKKSAGPNTPPPLALPTMTPIVNIKAAEKAVLSTEFHPLGEALNRNGTRKSGIRMQRIRGLNDHDDLGTGPVFETKLYYRANSVMQQFDQEMIQTDDEIENDDDIPLAELLTAQMPLEVYKKEKCQQIERWHCNHKAWDDDQAETKRTMASDGIHGSMTTEQVDQHVQDYFSWFQQQEWLARQPQQEQQTPVL